MAYQRPTALVSCGLLVTLAVWWLIERGDDPGIGTPGPRLPQRETPEILRAHADVHKLMSPEQLAAAGAEALPPDVLEKHDGKSAQASDASDVPWHRRYPRADVSPVAMFLHAPLAAKLEKIARNRLLNPRDMPLDRTQLEKLQFLLEHYQGSIRQALAAEGQARAKEMLTRASQGQLKTVDELQGSLSERERSAIAAELERHPGLAEEEKARMRAFLTKDALMTRLKADAALTTPSGVIYLAGKGELRDVLAGYRSYNDYLCGVFFGHVVVFCAVNGLLSDSEANVLLTDYFTKSEASKRQR
jgi:hypothetical protein